MKRSVLIASVTAIALVASTVAVLLKPATLEVEMAEARVSVFERTVEDEGKTRVRERYVVSAPVTGRLLRSKLKVGDSVQAGQTLLTILPQDPSLIDRRTRASLRARALAAQASVERAQAEAQRARTAENLARSEANRTGELARRGFVSESAKENADLALSEHEQARVAAERAREIAEFELRAALIALEVAGATAKGSDEEAWIVPSPVSGYVLRLPFDSEVAVQPGMALIEIGDTRALEVMVEVLSSEANAVAPGNPVRLTLGASTPLLTGTVRRVEPVARTRVSALGIDEQRATVVIDLPPTTPPAIGDGWRVDVSIVTESHTAALVIPVGALLRDREGWQIYRFAHGKAHLTRVALGGRNSREAWVTQGLSAGDTVIVHPPDSLRQGRSIRPRIGSSSP